MDYCPRCQKKRSRKDMDESNPYPGMIFCHKKKCLVPMKCIHGIKDSKRQTAETVCLICPILGMFTKCPCEHAPKYTALFL